MAGRGRGRGSNISFNVEALGISKGESLPAATLQQPPPHFPPLQYKAVPLIDNEKESYLLALKQEFRTAIRDLPYYYVPEEEKRDIARYSDKYQNGNHETDTDWQPDWSYIPDELKVRKVTKKKSAVPNTKRKSVNDVNVAQTLKKLEESEKQQEKEGEGSESEEKDEEELIEDGVYDEEEMEEETDYIMSYFDNGEGLDDEDDNIDDGPTYS